MILKYFLFSNFKNLSLKKFNMRSLNCVLTSSSFCKRSLSVSDILFSKCGPESLFSLL